MAAVSVVSAGRVASTAVPSGLRTGRRSPSKAARPAA
jgi:hypothetical protein